MNLDPTYTGAYYIRGLAYEKWGKVDKSIADYSTVLEIDPSHVNAAFARGAWENKRGNYLKAIEDYNMALELDNERDSHNILKRRINQNLGMSYVVPSSNEEFLSSSKDRIKANEKDFFDGNRLLLKGDPQCDLISAGGTNSFIEGGDQTPSIFSSTINSIESTPNSKSIDIKTK